MARRRARTRPLRPRHGVAQGHNAPPAVHEGRGLVTSGDMYVQFTADAYARYDYHGYLGGEINIGDRGLVILDFVGQVSAHHKPRTFPQRARLISAPSITSRM